MNLNCLICNKNFKKPPCRIKIGKGKYCSKKCYYKSREGVRVSIKSEFKKGHLLGKRIKKGQHLSPSTEFKKTKGKPSCIECKKELQSYTAKYCKTHSHSKEKSWFWKGGVCEMNKTKRQNFMRTTEYKIWRLNIFKRDNFTCIVCGYKGKKIQADHIKPFSLYPNERLSLSNGRTLCVNCHLKIGWHGNRYSKPLCV